MHVRIHHSTVYRYNPPAAGAIQILRLTPRDFDGQHVVRWRIELSADARLTPHEDAFGNITHVFTATGPLVPIETVVELTATPYRRWVNERRTRRRRHGGAEMPTRSARSTFVIRPSSCSSLRIFRSMASRRAGTVPSLSGMSPPSECADVARIGQFAQYYCATAEHLFIFLLTDASRRVAYLA